MFFTHNVLEIRSLINLTKGVALASLQLGCGRGARGIAGQRIIDCVQYACTQCKDVMTLKRYNKQLGGSVRTWNDRLMICGLGI